MKRSSSNYAGSTLVVTISVVAGLLVLLGIAVQYTTQVSRNTQRSRKVAAAMEIADGHLEYLFTSWRNIYRAPTFTYSNYTAGTDYSLSGTNYFFTTVYNPGPAPTPLPSMSPAATPPLIPLPPTSSFPSEPNYTVNQYRIQAVDPMVNLDANEKALVEGGNKGHGGFVPLAANVAPPGAYGPNIGPYGYAYPYSFYYLAAVDVQVPAVTGKVTAKVRRVFEKKFDLPWSYAMFYIDDLELHPGSSFTITGPVHTNGSLYISTSNFTAASPVFSAASAYQVSPTSGRIGYGADYVNGFSPLDPRYGGTVTAPNFATSNASLSLSDCPPSQVAAYMPFGWNLTLSAANSNTNDDSYREIVEPPSSSGTNSDPLQEVRYYNQARIKVEIKADNDVKVWRQDPTDPRNPSKNVQCTAASTGNDKAIYDLFVGTNRALTTNLAMFDSKENVNVRIAEVDMSKIQKAIDVGNGVASSSTLPTGISAVSGFTAANAVIYIADLTPAYNSNGTRNVVSSPPAKLGLTNVSTSERAIRLVNGHSLPTTGLTIVTPNPVYIKGNYNTGGTPPSNTTPTSAPETSTYKRRPSAVIGDAINVLSSNWKDADSTLTISAGSYNILNPRTAVSTTINTALVSGNIPSGTASFGASSNEYGGGGEGFIRLQEDWRTQNFVYYGSMVQLYRSVQANTAGSAGGQFFKSPATTRWFYDHETFSDASPPGDMVLAAYLQQQRWYQVY